MLSEALCLLKLLRAQSRNALPLLSPTCLTQLLCVAMKAKHQSKGMLVLSYKTPKTPDLFDLRLRGELSALPGRQRRLPQRAPRTPPPRELLVQ